MFLYSSSFFIFSSFTRFRSVFYQERINVIFSLLTNTTWSDTSAISVGHRRLREWNTMANASPKARKVVQPCVHKLVSSGHNYHVQQVIFFRMTEYSGEHRFPFIVCGRAVPIQSQNWSRRVRFLFNFLNFPP